MEVLRMPITQISVPPASEASDGKLVANFLPPNAEWTRGDMETDFPPSLLHTDIAAIIRQPEPGEAPGDAEAIVEVNDPWEVDVRWEFNGKAACFIKGVFRVKLFLESLGDDDLDREAKYPRDIPVDGRADSYHVQFQIAPDELKVEDDEGTPFQLTVAVILMVNCGPNGSLVPGPVLGKVNLPLIQAFREVAPAFIP
jgi:hypothetical protein